MENKNLKENPNAENGAKMTIPVVFCFDSRIILGASVAIKSLVECAKDSTTYDIRIFHSDIGLNDQKNLSTLVQNTRHNMAFHYVDPHIFDGAPRNKGSWTEIVYYRLLTPEILKEYDKAIYSDVDVLFKDDLSEVYNTNLEGYELAAVRAEKNHSGAIGHRYFEENKNEFTFWSGFLLFNCEKMRNEDYFKKFLETIKNFKGRLKFFDLDVINITCDNILPLSLKYCLLEPLYAFDDYKVCKSYRYLKDVYNEAEFSEAIKSPVIIHYAGELGKPWRRKNTPLYYKKYADELPKSLRKYTFRDFRKWLFNRR